MKFNLLNIDGGKSESIDVSDKIMKLKFNHKLVKYVIDWQLNHQNLEQLKQNREMKLEALQRKFMLKKELVKPGTQVKKRPCLLAGVKLTALKERCTRLKRLIKK